MDHRHRGQGFGVTPQAAGDGPDGGDDFRTGLPEEIAERGAVGMAHGEDATRVDRLLLLEVSQNGVEELDITATLALDGRLPTGHPARLVDERGDRRQPLRKHQDRSRIRLIVTPAAGSLGGPAAMTMPAEDDGHLAGDARRQAHESRAFHAVHGPLPLHESFRCLGREEVAQPVLGRHRNRIE